MLNQPLNQVIPRLAVPTIISMLVTAVYNMADTYFVARISTEASAAVGVVFSAMAIIQALAFTIGIRDVMGNARIESAASFRFFETYAIVMVIYWAFSLLMGMVQKRLEERSNAIYSTSTPAPKDKKSLLNKK